MKNNKVNEEEGLATVSNVGGMGDVSAPSNDGTNAGFYDQSKVGSGDKFSSKKKKKKNLKTWKEFSQEPKKITEAIGNIMSFMIGKEISYNVKLINNFSKENPTDRIGEILGVDMAEGIPLLVVVYNKDKKYKDYIMYDKNNDEFIEGMSTWKYVYTPLDKDAKNSFELLKNNSI